MRLFIVSKATEIGLVDPFIGTVVMVCDNETKDKNNNEINDKIFFMANNFFQKYGDISIKSNCV